MHVLFTISPEGLHKIMYRFSLKAIATYIISQANASISFTYSASVCIINATSPVVILTN